MIKGNLGALMGSSGTTGLGCRIENEPNDMSLGLREQCAGIAPSIPKAPEIRNLLEATFKDVVPFNT